MKYYILILFSFFTLTGNSQELILLEEGSGEFPETLDNKRRNILLISEVTLYSASLLALDRLWYSDYPKSNFHFINDNGEWLQMDKLGHLTTSYYLGVTGVKAYRWTGMSRESAIWYGGLTGTFFLTIIEVLDGHSEEWGASSGDLMANSLGSFLAISQELWWDEQRIQLKYSYSPSEWADENPKQLGGNHLQRLLKDYNGQTYWVSFNLKSLFNIQNTSFPVWISAALGYSGNKMIDPFPSVYQDRERQFLFSFDVDLNKIKTQHRFLNSILHTFGFLKFPSPAVELRNGNLFFHSIYY